MEKWTDSPPDTGGNYLRIEPDTTTTIRVASQPYTFTKVFDQESRTRHGCLVIDRDNHRVCGWEFGPMVRKQLAALAQNSKWGDPRDYDIDVRRDGSGMNTTYTLTPNPKTPVTSEDKQMVKDFDRTCEELFGINEVQAFGNEDPFSDD